MKIVVSVSALDSSHGGPSRTVPALCNALAESGADVELVTIVEHNLPIVQVARTTFAVRAVSTHADQYHPRSWRVAFKNSLLEAIAANKDTVLYDVGLWLPSHHFVAQIAAKTSTPVVASPRGMLSKEALKVSKWKKKIAWSLYQRRDLKRAKVLHATSKKEAEEFRGLGLNQPIAVVPNGVTIPKGIERTNDSGSQGASDAALRQSISREHSARTSGRRNFTAGGREPFANRSGEAGDSVLAKTEGTRTVLFLSRIHPIKGLKDLVQAWAKVRPNGWRAVIAGPDEDKQRARCEELAQSLGVRKDFDFVGPVDDDQKWKLLSQSDLFVLPSYSESFGMAIAEALAAGVPVITTKASPWQEIETHRCGWWVETGAEAIAAALRSATACRSEELRAMGARGRDLIVRNYSWDSVATNLLSVFEWILGHGEQPSCVMI